MIALLVMLASAELPPLPPIVVPPKEPLHRVSAAKPQPLPTPHGSQRVFLGRVELHESVLVVYPAMQSVKDGRVKLQWALPATTNACILQHKVDGKWRDEKAWVPETRVTRFCLSNDLAWRFVVPLAGLEPLPMAWGESGTDVMNPADFKKAR